MLSTSTLKAATFLVKAWLSFYPQKLRRQYVGTELQLPAIQEHWLKTIAEWHYHVGIVCMQVIMYDF